MVLASVPWERRSSVVAAKRQALAALVLKCPTEPCLTGSCWCWRNSQGSATFCPGSYHRHHPPTPRLAPHSGSGWWERAWPGLGQQLPPRNRWSGGKYFRVINAETTALKAHRWISRLAPAPGINVSSPKPSDTLTSLYIIPKKLSASCNWNWISGSSVAAVPSPPFALTLHLLSLHL